MGIIKSNIILGGIAALVFIFLEALIWFSYESITAMIIYAAVYWFVLIYIINKFKACNDVGPAEFISTYSFKTSEGEIKMKGIISIMEIQNDQGFFIDLVYPNDAGDPVAVEQFTKMECTNPAAVISRELDPGPNKYRFKVLGDMAGSGLGEINIDADARFGTEVKTISYNLPLIVTPDEAEGVTATVSDPFEQ